MKIQNVIAAAIAASLALGLGSVASAATVIANTGGNANVSFTGGAVTIGTSTGTLTAEDGQTPSPVSPVTISFSTGGLGTFTQLSPTLFDQNFLPGGSFNITGVGGTFLKGTFGASYILGATGAGGSGNIALDASSVVYDPSSTFLPAGLSLTGGSLSVEFVNVNGGAGFSDTATKLNNFTATDGITFTAVPAVVPEPTTVASFGFGGFGLLGLMVRARKARKTVA